MSVKTKRVNIALSDELHTRAKVVAVLKGVTLADYLESAVSEAVARDRKIVEKVQ